MAKRRPKSKRPQPQHKKQKKSQHDKHKRLQRKNSKRKKTTRAKVPLVGAVALLQACLDRRVAFRLAIIIAGMFLADDRRTASGWFVAAGVQDDWDRFYDCLISLGRRSEKLAAVVLGLVVQKFAPGLVDRITLGIDDSPTSRHGKHVEGAGVHHNPTPGPADGEWHGHNWVALAWLAKQPSRDEAEHWAHSVVPQRVGYCEKRNRGVGCWARNRRQRSIRRVTSARQKSDGVSRVDGKSNPCVSRPERFVRHLRCHRPAGLT